MPAADGAHCIRVQELDFRVKVESHHTGFPPLVDEFVLAGAKTQ